MIFTLGVLVIVLLTFVAILRSKKPIKIILIEAKYEIVFYLLACQSVMSDIVLRRKNKVELTSLKGRVAVVTGASRGIGLELTKLLLKCDIRVIVGCRNVKQLENLQENPNLIVLKLDLNCLESVQNFAEEITKKHAKINYLINCAGILTSPYLETKQGHESILQTNYLGHYFLTHLLLQNLRLAGCEKEFSRIVNVTSCAYVAGDINFDDINNKNQFVPAKSYAQSKLAQILFSNYLQKYLEKEEFHIQTHSVHPGIVDTDLFQEEKFKKIAPWASKIFFKTPGQGAVSVAFACLATSLQGKGGNYLANCQEENFNSKAKNEVLQEKLFEFTNKLLKIQHFGVVL